MADKDVHKRTLLRLSKGIVTIEELNQLVKIYEEKYKKAGKDIQVFIELQSFKELLKRLRTSVFSEIGKNYPEGFKKYCIYGEYQNTKLFIETTKKLVAIGNSHGDITDPKFYGQPNPGYNISLETLIHILLRHNQSLNSFINQDSIDNGHNPSSFSFGTFAEPMLTMLMALNVLSEQDWKNAEVGKNLICHFSVGGQFYTMIRKGNSKEILSFYPRNDDFNTSYVKLKRDPNNMQFLKE
jgi:hypothetical protein